MTTNDTGKPACNFAWVRWLSAYAAFTLVMLLVDAAMNHHDVIHENHWSWTPLIFAPLAFLFCVGAIFRKWGRGSLWVVGLLSIVVGMAGEYFHLDATLAERGHATIWHALLNSPRPILAPAAFAGLGLLLLLVAWGERRQGTSPSA